MRVQVFDIGNSFLKHYLIEIQDGRDPKFFCDHHTPTSKDFSENMEVIRHAYQHQEKDIVILLSMSDSVVWESAEGYKQWIPAQEPTHPYARLDQLPPYNETGKPQGEILSGVFNQLQLIKTQVNSQGFKKIRILPFSGFVAAELAGDKYFNAWDISHASNSGVFNYKIHNPYDERFPLNGWHACIQDIIDRGWISEKILPCDHVLHAPDGTPIMIGGHDTTFMNALHGIYSSKPYISCGTWLTASVESDISRDWKDEGARYVVAPNGSILKQLCIPAPTTDTGKFEAVGRIYDFFEKHLIAKTQSPIRVVGSWRHPLHHILSAFTTFEFSKMHDKYLQEQAARYAVARYLEKMD